MNKKAIELKIEAESYLWKYCGDDDDKKIATKLFIEAINKNNDGTMSNIQYADCCVRLAFSYIDRIEKSEEDFIIVLESLKKILTINLPSWYDRSPLINLLINPVRLGYNIKHKDVEYAKKIGIANMDAGTLYQVACKWTHYIDATEEEIDFAYYYYDHIVKHGVNYHNYTHAMAYCRMAMIYAYNKEKSIKNYNKACEYFKKSINTEGFLNSNSDQICIPFCQYSILLSRASKFGFPKECENNEEAEKYKKEIDEICKKNPSFLYYKAGEQYHFHKFANKEYFDISEKYYNNALNLPIISINVKIILNHYLADIYIKKKDKNIVNYLKSIEYSYNTIILCIDNHDLSNIAIENMQNLLYLLYDPEHFNFDILYIDDSYVTLIKNKIINIKDYYDTEVLGVLNRVIEVFHKVNVIKLKNNDIIFKERQKKVIENYIHNKNINSEKNELEELMSIKEKLSILEENSELYEYYDGFMRTFVQVYAVSVIIKSGQLSLNTDNLALTLSTKLISLIPLLGDTLSSTVDGVLKFIKSIEMVNKAVNIVKFSTSAEQFNEMVQDAILNIIINNRNKLLKIENSNEKSLKYYEKVQKFCETMKINFNETVYVQELETPMQKLGSKDASKLISEFISNGKIYNNELAIKIPSSIKKDRLTNYALIICFEKDDSEVKDDKINNDVNVINSNEVMESNINNGVNLVDNDSCTHFKYFFNFSK
jgi:hypothetical protein